MSDKRAIIIAAIAVMFGFGMFGFGMFSGGSSTSSAVAEEAGEMQIQFSPISVGDGVLNATVAMKNFTDTDYATIKWSCEFHQAGYTVGLGLAVFERVSQNHLTADRFMVSSMNDARGDQDISVECELIDTETRTPRNEKRPCYTCTPGRIDVEIDSGINSSDLWNDKRKPAGVAKIAGTKKPQPPVKPAKPALPNPLAEKI